MSAHWSFSQLPSSSLCPPGCVRSLPSLTPLFHPPQELSAQTQRGSGQEGTPGPRPCTTFPAEVSALSPLLRHPDRGGGWGGGGEWGRERGRTLSCPCRRENSHTHTHTHRHAELSARVTLKMYTHMHYSDTGATCTTTQIWPSSPPFPPPAHQKLSHRHQQAVVGGQALSPFLGPGG